MFGTKISDWAFFGTMNAETSLAMNRFISVHAAAKYNPWSWKGGNGGQINEKERSCALGFRYWPWNIYSGWWFGAGARIGEYNRGGLVRRQTEEGDAAGIDFYAGYTLMLDKHLNLELGLGIWAGRKRYRTYECPNCGRMLHDKQGVKNFVMPDIPRINLVWIF